MKLGLNSLPATRSKNQVKYRIMDIYKTGRWIFKTHFVFPWIDPLLKDHGFFIF